MGYADIGLVPGDKGADVRAGVLLNGQVTPQVELIELPGQGQGQPRIDGGTHQHTDGLGAVFLLAAEALEFLIPDIDLPREIQEPLAFCCGRYAGGGPQEDGKPQLRLHGFDDGAQGALLHFQRMGGGGDGAVAVNFQKIAEVLQTHGPGPSFPEVLSYSSINIPAAQPVFPRRAAAGKGRRAWSAGATAYSRSRPAPAVCAGNQSCLRISGTVISAGKPRFSRVRPSLPR